MKLSATVKLLRVTVDKGRQIAQLHFEAKAKPKQPWKADLGGDVTFDITAGRFLGGKLKGKVRIRKGLLWANVPIEATLRAKGQ